MYQETLSTKGVLHDLTLMASSLSKLLGKGKDYDRIIHYIIDNELYYNLYQSIPLKKLAKEMGLTYEHLRKQIHQILDDIIEQQSDFQIEIHEVEYHITLQGRENITYFSFKPLPVIPRIGEEVILPFFKELVGEEYFYVKNIRHEFYDKQQVVTIQLEGGHYNKWWHFRRDEAIQKGDLDHLYAWFTSDKALKKIIGKWENWKGIY